MYHDKYHFLWNDFTTHLSSMFRDLAQSSEYADVTLVSDDRKQSYAHKFVLSACSPVFKMMLGKNANQNPIIFLRGVNHQEIESMLQFMYLGETTIDRRRMNEFFNTAKSLEVKELCVNVDVAKNLEESTAAQELDPVIHRSKNKEEDDSFKNMFLPIEIQTPLNGKSGSNFLTEEQEEKPILPLHVQEQVEVLPVPVEKFAVAVKEKIEETPEFQCPECSKVCKDSMALKKHQFMSHDFDRQYPAFTNKAKAKHSIREDPRPITKTKFNSDNHKNDIQCAYDSCDYTTTNRNNRGNRNMTAHVKLHHPSSQNDLYLMNPKQ